MAIRFKNKSHTIAKKRAMGISFADNCVRYMALEAEKNNLTPLFFGEEALTDGAMVEGEIKHEEAIFSVLKKIRLKTGINEAHVSIPEQYVYVTLLPVTEENWRDLKSYIELHLLNHLPYSKEEYTFKYKLMKYDGKSVVHVYVFSKKIMLQYTKIFHAAGYKVLSIESEHEALLRVTTGNIGKTYMMADIGSDSTSLSIVNDNTIVFSKVIFFGKKEIIEGLKLSLGISEIEARAILERGLPLARKNPKEWAALSKSLAKLTDELDGAIVHWHSQGIHVSAKNNIGSIILSGALAGVSGIAPYLAQVLSTPVALANIWKNAELASGYIPLITFQDSLRFAAPLGLALKDLKKD